MEGKDFNELNDETRARRQKILKDKADHFSIKQEKAVEEAASGGHRAWNFTKFI
jgi:hypothetical protein